MARLPIVVYHRVNPMATRRPDRFHARRGRALAAVSCTGLIAVWLGSVVDAFDPPWRLALLASSQTKNAAGSASDRDVFGIRMLYATRDGTRSWTSAHWAGREYVIADRRDDQDPQEISGKRGTGTLTVADGILTMAGPQPRIYLNPYDGAPWRDVELTVYYQRVLDDGTGFAGMVAGVRAGTNGHTTDTPCDAHTYYARMRHDGAFDFAKELKHPSAAARGRVPAAQAWPEASELPRNRWIGFKYVSYNVGETVKLEVYRDLTEGKDGGAWIKVNEITDSGGWTAATDCAAQHPVGRTSDLRVLEGGTVFIRNTGVTDARYRRVSLREIRVP